MEMGAPAPKIDWIREKIRDAHYQISEHVIKFLMAGLLTVTQIETALITGQVVEIRRHPKLGGSALVRGNAGGKVVLVLCAKGHDEWLIISLAYLTIHPEWAELKCAKPQGVKFMENPFRKCFFCGGDVDSITVGNFDYRLEGKLYVIKNTPAGLCLQCGEKYVTAETAKKINALIEAGEFSGTEEVRVMEYM